MEFSIRRVGGEYYNVEVKVVRASIDLGLHDARERAELVEILQEAINELTEDD